MAFVVLHRYESPCGVMSLGCYAFLEAANPLRIPMRGYEAKKQKPKTTKKSLRIPMRGYEIDSEACVKNGKWVTNPHAGL